MDRLLSGLEGIRVPYVPEDSKPVYHLYSLLGPRRDALIQALGEKGISCGMHYPIPVHLQEAYSDLGLKKGSFPVAERCAEQQLSLPMFAELTDEQIDAVVEAIREFVESKVAV
jgi:dTDP-4-amino-4,6-dideoxygalactose transaminase